ncbi:MAG TPA: rod shape-determining protein MreC [Chitinophagales bacterium]|nr:rod shape-determining protein MreC [Chitinophagales bacterium]
MYNLFQFFLRYHLLFLFLTLEAFSFYLIYQTQHYNQVAYLGTVSEVSGKAYASYRGVHDYLYLRKFSDSLVNENAKLRARLEESLYSLKVDSGHVTDSTAKTVQHFTYISARVIKNSVNQATNLIYLDRGRLQGVEKQMGVINGNGIVGQVISVTDNYSAVKSVLSSTTKVSVKFKKNEFSGNIHWNGINSISAAMEDIPKHVPVKIGDTVVTSGFSQLYPRNVMVGTVSQVKMEPDKNFLDITINLSTNFNSLSYVYVVNNIRKEEIQILDTLVAKTK